MHFQLLSRAIALDINSKFYFTGTPCANGGLWVRRTSNRSCQCAICAEIRNVKTEDWRIKNPEIKLESRRKWCENNKDKLREINKRWREKDIDRARAMARESYQRNRESCLAIRRRYVEENKAEISERAKEYRKRNRERLLIKMKDYYQKTKEAQRKRKSENKEARRAWEAGWRERNRGAFNASRAKRRADKRDRYPSWIGRTERAKINSIYAESSRLSKLTGITFHVDHIIPLMGDLVSGLHVPENLRIIQAVENMSKGKKYVI